MDFFSRRILKPRRISEQRQTLIPRLRELKEKEPNVNEFCPLLSDQKFIEIYIGFLNGDWMTIACDRLKWMMI